VLSVVDSMEMIRFLDAIGVQTLTTSGSKMMITAFCQSEHLAKSTMLADAVLLKEVIFVNNARGTVVLTTTALEILFVLIDLDMALLLDVMGRAATAMFTDRGTSA
jgi:hypothetical protein